MATRTRKVRSVEISILKTTSEDLLEVKVGYELGGTNWFSGKPTSRGYYVSVQPVRIEDGFRVFMAFSGVKALVTEAKRYSDKGLLEAADKVKQSDLIEQLVDHVCKKQGLTLAEPSLTEGE